MLTIKIADESLTFPDVFQSTNNASGNFKILGVKVLVPIDIEKVNSINELVENIVTENRLLQGLEHLTMDGIEHDIKNTGAFIKWVNQDLIKEELATIIGSGFELKEVLTPAGKKAREWFFNQIFI